MTSVVLLASPLLGPSVWAPVADELGARGSAVTVPRLPDRIDTPDDVLDGFREGMPTGEPVVLVPHSNAGLYAAALAAARPVQAVVFVDAGLPAAAPATPTAPPGFRAQLGGLADDEGRLPPWTRWWPDLDLSELFPDEGSRAAVEAEQRRLPLSYFDAEVPSPAGWERLPAAYLGFGETYVDERTQAEARGWPVETLPGLHLHQLVDPGGVADALLRLLGRLGVVNAFP
jgi:pimeloyl-ACP methyl ester carboxylesterase